MNLRKSQTNRLLLLCVWVLLPALMGSFAACTLCETDVCCDDCGAGDEPCWCACALYAMPCVPELAAPSPDDGRYLDNGCQTSPPQETVYTLYRPPRRSARA